MPRPRGPALAGCALLCSSRGRRALVAGGRSAADELGAPMSLAAGGAAHRTRDCAAARHSGRSRAAPRGCWLAACARHHVPRVSWSLPAPGRARRTTVPGLLHSPPLPSLDPPHWPQAFPRHVLHARPRRRMHPIPASPVCLGTQSSNLIASSSSPPGLPRMHQNPHPSCRRLAPGVRRTPVMAAITGDIIAR